eukprot:INCI8808.1.p1 GENE.INCI8808.1~~INCI8808.1.p1  ORF type:complete len:364 (+),score=112.34 INCI8808.1:104-1195(+)
MHKLTLVEAERVMAVLQDTEDRLRLTRLIPSDAAYDLADRAAAEGFTEAAHAFRWLWKSEVAGSRDRRQNLRNVLRELNAHPALKDMLQEVAAEQAKHSESDASLAMDEFLAALDEHKKITVRKLSTTAEDAQLRKSFTEEVAQREKKLKDDYKELSDELNSLKQRREDEVTVLDKTIRKLQGELHSIQSLIRKEETSLAEEKRQKSEEADNSFKENSTALTAEVGELSQDLTSKVEKFATKESQMRKNKVKLQLNLKELVEKYDTDMLALQEQFDKTQKVFDAEQKELAELKDYFTKWDAERARIKEEEELIAAENRKKAEALKVLDDAAACIQKLYRGMKFRQQNKKGKKKKGKGKKKKKK